MRGDHDTLFAPTVTAAMARIDAVEPVEYAYSRNAVDGAISQLSPYITHGFVTLPEVVAGITARHPFAVQDKLMFQLGWRMYFRHRWAHLGDGILRSLHPGPLPDAAYAPELPEDIREGRTGIPAIDLAVKTLYGTGYLHNHARLWLASYVVHLRKVHWRAGADWMIAHLLDGDLASNHLSWQWVAGTASQKPYVFNAENVARFAPPPWHSPGTVLDTDYPTLDAWARNATARGGPTDASSTRGAGLAEPPVSPHPPHGVPPVPAIAQGRDVWLVHPWALRAPPSDLAPGALRLGVYLTDFHQRWPWSARRWQFVAMRMAALVDACWVTDTAGLARALECARTVRTVPDPHFDAPASALLEPMPSLFAPVPVHCGSFSKWWGRATAGLPPTRSTTPAAAASAPAVSPPRPEAPNEDPNHDSFNPSDRAGHRRARWHRT